MDVMIRVGLPLNGLPVNVHLPVGAQLDDVILAERKDAVHVVATYRVAEGPRAIVQARLRACTSPVSTTPPNKLIWTEKEGRYAIYQIGLSEVVAQPAD